MQDERSTSEAIIALCGPTHYAAALRIINAAADKYRGVIPADRWHEPYMPQAELLSEIAEGVVFSGTFFGDELVGVMGVQRRANVDLIRHAYVTPEFQGSGIGTALLKHLSDQTERPVLIGTWRAATWAIAFYKRYGFAVTTETDAAALLRCYWNIPDRQVDTSVVLARPALRDGEAARLIAVAQRT